MYGNLALTLLARRVLLLRLGIGLFQRERFKLRRKLGVDCKWEGKHATHPIRATAHILPPILSYTLSSSTATLPAMWCFAATAVAASRSQKMTGKNAAGMKAVKEEAATASAAAQEATSPIREHGDEPIDSTRKLEEEAQVGAEMRLREGEEDSARKKRKRDDADPAQQQQQRRGRGAMLMPSRDADAACGCPLFNGSSTPPTSAVVPYIQGLMGLSLNMQIAVFFLPLRAVMPLHDHPGMRVFSKLLLGSAHVEAYDWVRPRVSGWGSARLAEKVLDHDVTEASKTWVLFPDSGGNMHRFVAGEEAHCAFLDVLAPPYSSTEERYCTYYKDIPYKPCRYDAQRHGRPLAWLVEVAEPDLRITNLPYQGPARCDRTGPQKIGGLHHQVNDCPSAGGQVVDARSPCRHAHQPRYTAEKVECMRFPDGPLGSKERWRFTWPAPATQHRRRNKQNTHAYYVFSPPDLPALPFQRQSTGRFFVGCASPATASARAVDDGQLTDQGLLAQDAQAAGGGAAAAVDASPAAHVALMDDVRFSNEINAAGHQNPPIITYKSIYECSNFTGAAMPLHDHPGMTVFSKLLVGSAHVVSYDWVCPRVCAVAGSSESEMLAEKVLDREFTSASGAWVLFPETGGNLHRFVAVKDEPCAFLDVITPRYSPTSETQQQFAFYKDFPYELHPTYTISKPRQRAAQEVSARHVSAQLTDVWRASPRPQVRFLSPYVPLEACSF
ncbi:hypothetical protein HU200_044245 [Digitaria exilis]|uniref:cysteine dioxygenase n=1 Tax=Digitaria exilis TaxID=1010633 RepID=A0A835EFJ8_9POAL|nr:hypothetical protein HU200_044245 [Digitaria exilis]